MSTDTMTQAFTAYQLHFDPTLLPIRTDVRWREHGRHWQYGRLLDVKVTSLGEYVVVYNHRSDHSARRSDYLPGNRIIEVVTAETRQTTHEITASEVGEPHVRFCREVEVTDIYGKRHRGVVRGMHPGHRGLVFWYEATIRSGVRTAHVSPDSIVTVFEEMD